ncbi:hypothetical protein Pint_23684 [Pistacia integerrima]|uniref:Uncharacterized protein n=1 Tax=Pistacia integerrima TaxID=434235 RepID=A0ACC0YJG7_9ROSI|nr:hypothetical protein Pint_23684 [Pistacia integerrima]
MERFANSKSDIGVVKAHLHFVFTIKDLGYAKYFLGIEIARSSEGTFINQQKYILDILEDTSLVGAKPVSTLFSKAASLEHWDSALYILRYLKGCPSKGLFFPAHSSFTVTAYCDAD